MCVATVAESGVVLLFSIYLTFKDNRSLKSGLELAGLELGIIQQFLEILQLSTPFMTSY